MIILDTAGKKKWLSVYLFFYFFKHPSWVYMSGSMALPTACPEHLSALTPIILC